MNQPPVSYGILLYPGFEVLDVAGPIECLNTLAHHNVTPNMTLSVIARPREHHPDLPIDIDPYVEKPNIGGEVFLRSQVYKATHTFTTAPPLDMLLIPGGFGSVPPEDCDAEIEFLRDVFPSLKYLLTICTGAGIAGKSGILDGRKATTNKAVWGLITPSSKKTCWIAKARWVQSGNIWTTSGVSAGTDGMVAFLATVYEKGVIDSMINAMEYNRVVKADDDPFAEIWKAKDVCPESGCVCGKQA